MKSALIIGGSGFLGSNLLDKLYSQGFKLYATVHKTEIRKDYPVEYIPGGIRALQPVLIDKIRPRIIFHCARPTLPRLRRLGRRVAAAKARRYNMQLIRNLENTADKPLLLFASGSLAYGNSQDPHYETAPLNPISYARQYQKGEMPVLHASQQGMLPVKILRFPWLLGHGSWFSWFYLDSIRKENRVPRFGPGKNFMDILDVRDAASLMLRHGLSKLPPGIYNIPSSGAVTQMEFNKLTAAVFKAEIITSPALFSAKLEKEAMEAFNSNIRLATLFPEVLEGFVYLKLRKSLEEIKLQEEKLH